MDKKIQLVREVSRFEEDPHTILKFACTLTALQIFEAHSTFRWKVSLSAMVQSFHIYRRAVFPRAVSSVACTFSLILSSFFRGGEFCGSKNYTHRQECAMLLPVPQTEYRCSQVPVDRTVEKQFVRKVIVERIIEKARGPRCCPR